MNERPMDEPDDLSDLIDTTWHTGAGRMSAADRALRERAGFTVLSSLDLYRQYDIWLTPYCLFGSAESAGRHTIPNHVVLRLADHVLFEEDMLQRRFLLAQADDAQKLVALGYGTPGE
jgi:hypothetical protein